MHCVWKVDQKRMHKQIDCKLEKIVIVIVKMCVFKNRFSQKPLIVVFGFPHTHNKFHNIRT